MVIAPLNEHTLDLLSFAVQWWVQRGLRFVNLPWVVDPRYSAVTRPAFARDIETPHGVFVASGEQSFMELWEKGALPPHSEGYVGWTPCLRDEPKLDELHYFGFMKAEVFIPLTPESRPMTACTQLVSQQLQLFTLLCHRFGVLHPALTTEVISAEQIDILLNDIEIGSYGVRALNDRKFLYGTALALPRFSQALARPLCA